MDADEVRSLIFKKEDVNVQVNVHYWVLLGWTFPLNPIEILCMWDLFSLYCIWPGIETSSLISQWWMVLETILKWTHWQFLYIITLSFIMDRHLRGWYAVMSLHLDWRWLFYRSLFNEESVFVANARPGLERRPFDCQPISDALLAHMTPCGLASCFPFSFQTRWKTEACRVAWHGEWMITALS